MRGKVFCIAKGVHFAQNNLDQTPPVARSCTSKEASTVPQALKALFVPGLPRRQLASRCGGLLRGEVARQGWWPDFIGKLGRASLPSAAARSSPEGGRRVSATPFVWSARGRETRRRRSNVVPPSRKEGRHTAKSVQEQPGAHPGSSLNHVAPMEAPEMDFSQRRRRRSS